MSRVMLVLVSFVVAASNSSISLAAQCDVPKISLTQGMEYSKAREELIASGWQARQLSAYGYQESDDKVRSDCFNSVDICNAYPEIESCSGQGQCLMMFSDAFGNKLEVITYGQLGSQASVQSFSVQCQ